MGRHVERAQSYETVFASTLGNAIGESIASPNIKTLGDVGGTPIQRLTQPDLRTMDVPELNLGPLPQLNLAPSAEELQADFRASERAYRQATDTGAVIQPGDTLERLTNGDKALMGRYAAGMGLQSMNGLRVGQSMVADWSMSESDAVASANRFYAEDGRNKAVLADGLRVGPTIARAQALGIYSGGSSSFALSGDYATISATKLSARETATDWFSSVVGRSRAGNVLTGAFDAWMATPEALSHLPNLVTGIPSALGRLADSTASYAGRLWDDPLGTAANTLASGVDGFRSSFNKVVNGDGRAMGSTLFAVGTAAMPIGRLEAGLPNAVAFEGTLYRAVGAGHDPLLIHPGNIAVNRPGIHGGPLA